MPACSRNRDEPRIIRNRIQNCATLAWADLCTYELNTLKDEDTRDPVRLAHTIKEEGFCAPIFVWADHRYVVDGTCRVLALRQLEAVGYTIENIPFVAIQADNQTEAHKIAVYISSQYGFVTQASLDRFVLDTRLTEQAVVDLGTKALFRGLEFRVPATSLDDTPPLNTDLGDEKKKGKDAFRDNEDLTEIVCPACGHTFETGK